MKSDQSHITPATRTRLAAIHIQPCQSWGKNSRKTSPAPPNAVKARAQTKLTVRRKALTEPSIRAN
jgi:hypothetical protein